MSLSVTAASSVMVCDPAFVAEMPGSPGVLLTIGHFDEVGGVTHIEIRTLASKSGKLREVATPRKVNVLSERFRQGMAKGRRWEEAHEDRSWPGWLASINLANVCAPVRQAAHSLPPPEGAFNGDRAMANCHLTLRKVAR